jgi:hypothetical protein
MAESKHHLAINSTVQKMISLFLSIFCLLVFGAIFDIVLLIFAQSVSAGVNGLVALALVNATMWFLARAIKRKGYPDASIADILWVVVIFFMCGDAVLGTVILWAVVG